VDQIANVDVAAKRTIPALLEIEIMSPARNYFILYVYNNRLLSEHSTAGDRSITFFPGPVCDCGRGFLTNFHHTTAQNQV
jgi:hypothetical protein